MESGPINYVIYGMIESQSRHIHKAFLAETIEEVRTLLGGEGRWIGEIYVMQVSEVIRLAYEAKILLTDVESREIVDLEKFDF